MTTDCLKMGAEPTPQMLCISNAPHTMDSVQHNIHIMNQPLSQTIRESERYILQYNPCCYDSWMLSSLLQGLFTENFLGIFA